MLSDRFCKVIMPQGSWNETKTIFQYVPNVIFVFGSNLAGRHGLGAAKFARTYYGARYGVAVGRTGNAYAIPTKDFHVKAPLPIYVIKGYVEDFLRYSAALPNERFLLTRVGCGLSGYKDSDMAPLYVGITDNVLIPKEWEPWLKPKTNLVL